MPTRWSRPRAARGRALGLNPPLPRDQLVQGYVHALLWLDPDTLDAQAPGLLRVDPEALDLLEFQRLTREARSRPAARAAELRRRALELWRGPPLADVVFEGPARHEVGQLGNCTSSRVGLLEAELELGHLGWSVSSRCSSPPIPTRSASASCVLALYRSGRQAEALQAYKAARRMLSDELGLEPGQALRELGQRSCDRTTPCQGASRSTARDPGTSVSAGPATPPARGDELRPVTALFADIVGSTALGEALCSCRDVKALVGECVTQMSKAVEEYVGTVQAYGGRRDLCVLRRSAGPRTTPSVPRGPHSGSWRWSANTPATSPTRGRPDFAVRVGINTGRAGVGQVGAGSPQGRLRSATPSTSPPGSVGSDAGDDRRGRCDRAPPRPSVRVRAARRAHRQGRAEPVRHSRLVGPIRNRCSSAPPAARRTGGRGWARCDRSGRLRVRSGPGHPFLGEPASERRACWRSCGRSYRVT